MEMSDDESRTHFAIGEDNAACQSCRRRKLGCTREIPSCSHCRRLSCPCIYDQKKQKPGIKSGVIDGLSKRIEALERQLEALQQRADRPDPQDTQGCLYHAALLVSNSASRLRESCDPGSTKAESSNINYDSGPVPSSQPYSIGGSIPRRSPIPTISSASSTPDPTLSPHLLAVIFRTYFAVIHPWIPCVHQPRFEERLQDHAERPKLKALIDSMVSCTVKHLTPGELSISAHELAELRDAARDKAMQRAMSSLSVENVQALIILAFDHIGSGRLQNAWPIIGSLTRTVEYLQLNIESDEISHQTLLTPLTLLNPSQDWAEEEERRRIFWNVFLLDRFCAVATRWSTSLTSSDVSRRLPSDGKTWRVGAKAVTPHFGVWDKSLSSIDRSIAHIPIERSATSYFTPTRLKQNSANGGVDPANVGAFAYRIEATESLRQVSSFFLQQPVNFCDRQEVANWLTRFKELDLRLVHWKTFLPPRWKDSDISRDGQTVNMDPNLTLAHLTHNTSTILLHQYIAYPPLDLSQLVQLPSSWSAETCRLAAIEIACITAKYLEHATTYMVPAQFGFSVFVAARTFLAHWKEYGGSLHSEFNVLCQSLRSISQGWHLKVPTTDNSINLADKYISVLLFMKGKIQTDPGYATHSILQSDIQTDYEAIQHLSPFQDHQSLLRDSQAMSRDRGPSLLHEPGHVELGDPEAMSTQPHQLHGVPESSKGGLHEMPLDETHLDGLAVMSGYLLDQEFLDLDRVITLNGTDFTMNHEIWREQFGSSLE